MPLAGGHRECSCPHSIALDRAVCVGVRGSSCRQGSQEQRPQMERGPWAQTVGAVPREHDPPCVDALQQAELEC